MKVVLSLPSCRAQEGGPPRSVAGLASALARAGAEVEILTADAEASNKLVLPAAAGIVISRHGEGTDRTGLLGPSQGLEHFFAERSKPGVILHDNGIWRPENHWVTATAHRRGIPTLVSPRGMLTRWSWNHHRLKKRLAWFVYQRRDLCRAKALHATSAEEAEDLRQRHLHQPIAVIPNGVEIPELTVPSRKEKRRALFLSRIHPKKGLENLIEAWAAVRPRKWEMVIAGPDSNGYRSQLEQRVLERGLASDVRFIGSVSDTEKWNVYGESDLFILPSLSENFGLVVAEALAAGLPVITTRATPWQQLESAQCGWWIDTSVEALVQALKEVCVLGEDQLKDRGQRGRALVRGEYSWDKIAQKMLKVYSWATGEGVAPGYLKR